MFEPGFVLDYDPAKNAWNIRERGLNFERSRELDWSTATISEDVRLDYPERRFVAVGYLDGRLHVLCFTPIDGGMRVFSFRKANKREARKNEKTITLN